MEKDEEKKIPMRRDSEGKLVPIEPLSSEEVEALGLAFIRRRDAHLARAAVQRDVTRRLHHMSMALAYGEAVQMLLGDEPLDAPDSELYR